MSGSTLLERVAAHGSTYIIGGGGKTTLMFWLAAGLLERGRRVITTTSTRIFPPTARQSAVTLLGQDVVELAGRFSSRGLRHATVARSRVPQGKLGGFSPPELDTLLGLGVARHLLVEADGSAGRSFKAHASHEPVVSAAAGLVLAVIGVDCLGCPVDDAHVHRAALLRQRLDLEAGALVTYELVARAFFHPLGYLRAVPPGAELGVVFTQVESPRRQEQARALDGALRAADPAGRVAGTWTLGLAGSGRVRVGVPEGEPW